MDHLKDSVNDRIPVLRKKCNVRKFYMLPLLCVLEKRFDELNGGKALTS